jgi:hypothetical protein
MALPITSISLSNTFGQWIIVTQNIVTELNALDARIKSGTLTKDSGTFFINSSGIGLAVANTATFGNIQVSNTALFTGNVVFNRPITVNSNSALIAGVELKENLITFSTITPRVDTYIGVNRGIGYSNAQIRWLEGSKKWQIRNVDSPSTYYNIITTNDAASISGSGIVQLNDDYTSTSTTQAATINAVKKVYDALSGGSGGAEVGLAYTQANNAYTQANTARNTANAAFEKANTAAGGGITKVNGGTSGYVVPTSGEITFNSTNGITFTGSGSTMTTNTPQDLRSTASPTFNIISATEFRSSTDSENAFGSGFINLKGATPTISLKDTTVGTGGSVWFLNNDGVLNILANNNPNATVWNNTAATYTISTNRWVFTGNIASEGTIFCSGNIATAATFAAKSIGDTTFKGVANNYSISNCEKVFFNANNSTVILPATPSEGNFITIGVGNFSNTNVIRNGKLIMGIAEDMRIDRPNVSVQLVYTGDVIGWKIV